MRFLRNLPTTRSGSSIARPGTIWSTTGASSISTRSRFVHQLHARAARIIRCESVEPYNQTAQWYQKFPGPLDVAAGTEPVAGAGRKLRVRDKCRWYDTDEHRFYRYNYYTDNCSTRVRDVLDEALDGQIKAQLANQPTDTTFRWHTRRLTRESVPWYFAAGYGSGPATDRPIYGLGRNRFCRCGSVDI